MVSGGITAAGRCGLHIFDKGERVNAVKYISVLNYKVKLHMHISGATIFLQDWEPCLRPTARTVQKWFVDNHIEVLPHWPSNSPNLNVIENCWNNMKKKVAAHRPVSEKDLKDILRHVWVTEISLEYCKTLVHSMPSRIKAVIKNHGHPTRYLLLLT